eukprot:GFYU01027883.1.p1 GENE.GFYU01027883.1~~GFYU01027883.1.p1  ORF type:complete len:173 (+),score=23.46 GFYU01027883.1:99-617(+)
MPSYNLLVLPLALYAVAMFLEAPTLTAAESWEDCDAKPNCRDIRNCRFDMTPSARQILLNAGTERAGTMELKDTNTRDEFVCGCCGQALFRGVHKYNSGSGWPSFNDVAHEKSVIMSEDNTVGMRRVEVSCRQCGSHLGHVFEDGPKPTGLRYCINGQSLKTIPIPDLKDSL